MQGFGGIGRVLDAVRFLSRLPLPEGAGPFAPLATTLRAAPAAGVLIAALPALVLALGSTAGLPSLAAASLGIVTMLAVTGGLHEDGLADVADGFWGGATVSRKLIIMRDSRIGAYGTLAIGAALLLRVSALSGLIDRAGAGPTALAFVGAAALSRGLMLLPLACLPPARQDGLGKAAEPGDRPMLPVALAGAVGLAVLFAAWAVPDGLHVLAGLMAAGATALGMTRLARQHLGGVTGDVVGATQQAVEIVFLLVLCSGAGTR